MGQGPPASSSLSCPPQESFERVDLPGRGEPPPRVDERLAPPETRLEYLHGLELFAAPAREPHAVQHDVLTRVVGSHVAAGYTSAVDMLTRTDHDSDFAPDVSIFPSARDPETGGRRLEELAFEVVSEQALSVTTSKARELARRGVRRIFCVLVEPRRVLEWSRETDGWSPLAPGAVIEDRCLVRPMPVAALLDAMLADDAVAKALLHKRPPAIAEALEAERDQGQLAQARASLVRVLVRRGLAPTAEERAQIDACVDLATLERWLDRAIDARSARDALAG
jgi:hypothetical protein